MWPSAPTYGFGLSGGRIQVAVGAPAIVTSVTLRLSNVASRGWGAVWQAHKRRMKALQPDPALWQRLSAVEWLRAGGQAEAAAFDVDAQAAPPWWIKLLSWAVSGGRQAPATLPQLEPAHWRGDAAEAARLADAVCRRPGIVARLSSEADDAQPLSAARQKLVNNGRRAICQGYGTPVAARP